MTTTAYVSHLTRERLAIPVVASEYDSAVREWGVEAALPVAGVAPSTWVSAQWDDTESTVLVEVGAGSSLPMTAGTSYDVWVRLAPPDSTLQLVYAGSVRAFLEWTYTGNPNTSKRDQVRYLIGDTREERPLLANAEVDFELAAAQLPGPVDRPFRAAARCAEAIAARMAAEGNVKVGDVSVDRSKMADGFRALAKALWQRSADDDPQSAQSANGLDWTAMGRADGGTDSGVFAMGQHRNPEAVYSV